MFETHEMGHDISRRISTLRVQANEATLEDVSRDKPRTHMKPIMMILRLENTRDAIVTEIRNYVIRDSFCYGDRLRVFSVPLL